jgi:alpha-tubulin suppressor-like RCC1 family protein
MSTLRLSLPITLLILCFGTLVSCAGADAPTASIRYLANGGSGAVPTDTTSYSVGATAIILEPGELARADHAFTGWNTAGDGSGTLYQPGSTITVGTTDITLSATWRRAPTIATGGYHTAALADDTLSTWGYNFYGQLGDGTPGDKSFPNQIGAFGANGATVVTIATGGYHSAALLSDGTLFTWGSNVRGQLGHGMSGNRGTPTQVPAFAPLGTTIAAIATGDYHTAALLSDGSLFTWGENALGQLGDGTTTDRSTPTRVPAFGPDGTTSTAVAAGGFHTAVLVSDGSLYAWGLNSAGQLGDGTSTDSATPVKVAGFAPAGTTITALATGGYHSAALLDDGTLYTWGYNLYGQLGNGTTTDASTPTPVPGFPPPGSRIASIATGGFHTMALLDDGSLYAWGWNFFGQIADATWEPRATPTLIRDFPPAGTAITAIAAGAAHAAALLDDGTLFAWGYNEMGQLGDGTTEDRRVPTRVLGPFRVTAVDE